MYKAPVADILHAMNAIAGMDEAMEKGRLGDLSADLVEAVLGEAAKFAAEEIAPLRMAGDRAGTSVKDGVVTTAPGWTELYKNWTNGGWNAIAGPEEFGGQALPSTMSMAATEMWNAASMAFGLCPMLTMGAIEALEKHGSDHLKTTYLEKLISGEWTGTMNLTEPQAGSDLNALRAKAEPLGDGRYKVFGQKIYITYGEHEMTDNIVHLVLARLPDAPAGTRGISLFLVPKFHVNEDGSLGARNDVFCHSVEHKLGINASPTCTMIYGDGKFGDEPGAIGWLIGEENRGLACMFTMMNNARLAVGVQGVAVADAAYQLALHYANERKQGRAPGAAGPDMSAIIGHPDVARDLVMMKSLIVSARAICTSCAHALDMAKSAEGDEQVYWRERANLLTPLAKAYSTDIGMQVTSMGVQIHGGMGFVEETGAAVLMRDARIAPIYEGTNGIQAIDLVMRKLPQSGGAHINGFLDELAATIENVRASNQPAFGDTSDRLAVALEHAKLATAHLFSLAEKGDSEAALAVATPYLRLISETSGAIMIAGGAAKTGEMPRIAVARFMAENGLSDTAGILSTVLAGAETLNAARSALEAA